MQSRVVDIKSDDVLVNIESNPLELSYNLNHCQSVYKTEVGWKLVPGTNGHELFHGSLENPYRLFEIHGHMVGDSCLESCRRHSVDGKEYAGELHLVHYDSTLSFSPNKLNKYVPDRRAIVCILLEEGKINNELSKFTNELSELSYKVQKIGFKDDVNPTYLLPEKLDFWMYKEETLGGKWKEYLTWIIFKNPIEASKEQINAMRSPYGRASGPGNAIQPQTKRTITEGQAILKRCSVGEE